jgi:hypothetical protein
VAWVSSERRLRGALVAVAVPHERVLCRGVGERLLERTGESNKETGHVSPIPRILLGKERCVFFSKNMLYGQTV